MSTEIRVHLRPGAVRDLVRRDGLTNERVARDAGISRVYLQRLLSGDRNCSWELLLRLAAALRVEPTTIADIEAVAPQEVA